MGEAATQSWSSGAVDEQHAVAPANDVVDGSAAGTVDARDPVSVVSDIEQSLADLDALLSDVGELPPAEDEAGGDKVEGALEEPVEKEAVPVTSQPAELVDVLGDEADSWSDGGVDDEPASQTCAESPPVQEGMASEQEWTDAAETPVAEEPPVVTEAPAAQESPAEPSTGEPVAEPIEPVAEADGPEESVRSWWRRLAFAPVAGLTALLVLMDIPFSRVSLGAKNMLGYVAVATLVMATAVWVVGATVISQ